MADSFEHPGGAVVWPGFGMQGSNPVAVISADVPQAKPLVPQSGSLWVMSKIVLLKLYYFPYIL